MLILFVGKKLTQLYWKIPGPAPWGAFRGRAPPKWLLCPPQTKIVPPKRRRGRTRFWAQKVLIKVLMCNSKVHICTFYYEYTCAISKCTCVRALMLYTFHVHVLIRVLKWYQKYLLSAGAFSEQKLTCTLDVQTIRSVRSFEIYHPALLQVTSLL